MAGSLRPIRVPSEGQEAARDLVRAREQVRGDLMRCRHRVSKLLLRHGRVWPAEPTTWTVAHRDWLAGQRFDAAGAAAGVPRHPGRGRRAAGPPRGGRAALPTWPQTPSSGPSCATASLPRGRHPDRAGGRARDRRLRPLWAAGERGAGSGWCLSRRVRRDHQRRADHQERLQARAPDPGAGRLALPARPASARRCATVRTASPPTCCRSPGAPSTACTDPLSAARARQARQRRHHRRRARARLLPLGRRHGR